MAGNAMIGCERVGLKVFTTAITSVAAVMVHSVPLPPLIFFKHWQYLIKTLGGQCVDGCQQHT